jgi:hypothetical protein
MDKHNHFQCKFIAKDRCWIATSGDTGDILKSDIRPASGRKNLGRFGFQVFKAPTRHVQCIAKTCPSMSMPDLSVMRLVWNWFVCVFLVWLTSRCGTSWWNSSLPKNRHLGDGVILETGCCCSGAFCALHRQGWGKFGGTWPGTCT